MNRHELIPQLLLSLLPSPAETTLIIRGLACMTHEVSHHAHRHNALT